MATTAAEIEFFARVDSAERVEVLIERMALACGDAPIDEDYLTGEALAAPLGDDEPEPALVTCEGCGGSGWMWAGTGEETPQFRVTCAACDGEGEVEPGEEQADSHDDGTPQSDEPEPPGPAAPNVIPFPARRPFDRAAHCRAIAAGGGARTVALYGAQHMRAIGRAGARATIERHGLATFKGIVAAKGWAGPRRTDLAADLALGAYLADAA